MQGAWMGCFQGYRGEAIQDLGDELRRIPIPRISVNKGKKKDRSVMLQPGLRTARFLFAKLALDRWARAAAETRQKNDSGSQPDR